MKNITDEVKRTVEDARVKDDFLYFQYEALASKADHIYRFVNLFKNVFGKRRDYGHKGLNINVTEIHDLTFIDDNPGATATDLVNETLRTRGAVSQSLARLEELGLIYRIPSPENAKMLQLYTTAAGKILSDEHKAFDVRSLSQMHAVLLKSFSQEEIDSFYQILEYLVVNMQSWAHKILLEKRLKKEISQHNE